jgi:hypothetical protein
VVKVDQLALLFRERFGFKIQAFGGSQASADLFLDFAFVTADGAHGQTPAFGNFLRRFSGVIECDKLGCDRS